MPRITRRLAKSNGTPRKRTTTWDGRNAMKKEVFAELYTKPTDTLVGSLGFLMFWFVFPFRCIFQCWDLPSDSRVPCKLANHAWPSKKERTQRVQPP
ncbi:hypothetical protein M408DRAFT_119431 [Serendipita vermifera MAFF 305830]|uniref:Uncharacterized protein n=1 Tax=Serendipita vermifera MAFF 305830 TaxID=933852 RepID=A0A0C3BCL5_SERVB|nr:hypothetical protein M408DRAFT_119431 [Serendipita vermifera MAFF 305830]